MDETVSSPTGPSSDDIIIKKTVGRRDYPCRDSLNDMDRERVDFFIDTAFPAG